jgi:putative tricarboxylic transport membrane protein
MWDRRDVLKAGAGGLALLAGLPAFAQQQINQLNMFIPAAPGGGWDGTGRAMERAMRAAGIVQNFQFDHAPGAGGAVGLPRFLQQRRGSPDTLMVAGMVMVGALITNRSPVRLLDATPIARLTGEALAVVVPAASPFQNMRQLVDAFKADPARVSWAGGSAGGSDHILAGLIAKAVGLDARRVSYVAVAGGGPAQAALLGNQVSAGISGYSEFAEQVRAGRLRALAVSTPERVPGIDVPTLKEGGIDVDLVNWRGVFGGPGISPAQRDALVGLVRRMVESDAWKQELERNDWVSLPLYGEEYGRYVQSEFTRIEGILKDIGLAS